MRARSPPRVCTRSSTREHQIEQDEVRTLGSERIQRLGTVGAEHGVESLCAQDDPNHLGEGGVIVDDQDA